MRYPTTGRRIHAPSGASLRNALLAALALSLLLPLAAHADPPEPSESWYVLEIGGRRAGWMKESVDVQGDRIRTGSQVELTVARAETRIEIVMRTEFIETLDGHPVSMRSMQQLAGMPVDTRYVFGDDAVRVVTKQGPSIERTTKPLPDGEWLTPGAADREIQRQLDQGAQTITIRTLDPSTGLTPVTYTRRVDEQTTVDVLGKTVPAIRWIVSADAMPGIETIEFVDEDGETLRSEISLGVIELTVVRADKDIALAELDPPELLLATLVEPDRPIEKPRKLRSATFVISADKGDLPDLPSTGYQRSQRLDAMSSRITVDLDEPALADEADRERYLVASTFLNAEDERVAELAAEATENAGDDPAARAEAMRRFVHDYIDAKSLDVGFASASEVARTRAGDCSEHATLLAAMLRADGIPARTISGLVYVRGFADRESVFGYHMWTQAILDIDGEPRWIDLDAIMDADRPFDATHIALAVTELDDGLVHNALVDLVPLLGRISINVVEPD